MLDNLIVNIKRILPKAKTNNVGDTRIGPDYDYKYDESTVAFIERHKTDSEANNHHSMMNAMRSYFDKLYRRKPEPEVDKNIMLPRVLNHLNDPLNNWESIELKVKEKLIEDIDNVLDKFTRVISVNEMQSPQRDQHSYKRNDREEIRRRLAMGAEDDYLTKISQAKPTRKSSLHTRLQEGMNLQICYVNDGAAVTEGDSPSSDSETCPKLSKPTTFNQKQQPQSRHNIPTVEPNPYSSRPLTMKKSSSNEKPRSVLSELQTDEDPKEIDFFTKQARLQIEARMALAQAKDIAHMQMEMERQKQKANPITNMIRSTVEKIGFNFPAEKRRVSRQMLTDMNVAQLQIIVNDFHSQIEGLNEQLVKFLMERDDLHMGQDSMLVDIEDLTRYLGAKKDPYYERKKSTKKFHSMKSPKYLVTHKYQQPPQHKQLASQIGKS